MAFKTIECDRIQVFYPDEKDVDEEYIGRAQRKVDAWVEEQRKLDKPAYFIGTNEIVKIFLQKCVFCLKSPSVYAFD